MLTKSLLIGKNSINIEIQEEKMVKHIILWTLKEMTDSEKESVKKGIKEGLEGLKGKIPGLVDIKV